MATIGVAGTVYTAARGESKELWLPLGYFALMEILQALTYLVLNDCSAPSNHILTVLSFIHISFQPFFINAMSLYFVPKDFRKKIAPFVYTVCFAGTILLLLKLYPFQLAAGWPNGCPVGKEALCGANLCSVRGTWHMAWNIPLNSFSTRLYTLAYFVPAFLIPLLYGSWPITIYLIIFGPVLGRLLSSNLNEWPAVWCLFSIALILAIIKTPLRSYFHVQKWYAWKFPWQHN
jgi:hypothetical protein